jgi:YVTN family beta-propeller protein
MRHNHGRAIAFATGMPLIVYFATLLSSTVAAEEPTGQDYLGPSTLVVSEDERTLYVACTDASQVIWVDLISGKVIRRVDMPAEPTGIVLSSDGTGLVVSCAAPSSTVAVLDAASGRIVATIQAGHTAMSPVIHPDGRRLYVCNRFSNNVSVIDLVAGHELARISTTREPIAADITPDGKTLLVANHLPNTRTDLSFRGDIAAAVTMIDTATHETTTVPLSHGAHSLRGLAVSPDGTVALVTHLMGNFEQIPFQVNGGWINVNVVSVIDIQQRKRVGTLGMDDYYYGAGNPYDVRWTADGQSVCVSLSGTHQLSIIDSAYLLGSEARYTMEPMMGVWPIYLSLGESPWDRMPLPGKGARGLAVAGSKVYVAQYFSDSVAVYDQQAADDAPIGTIALGPPPELTERRRGQLLFEDATICYQQWQSCASCHPDARMDGLNWDLVNDGTGNRKNTKSMLLSHRTAPAMATGIRESAEAAVRAGLNHILFTYRPDEDADAIDAYLESLQPVPSPHLCDGQLTTAAQRGEKLFFGERINCSRCHPAPLYTDQRRHDVGTRQSNEYTDRFDTPTLVEVWRTAPYLHDGRYATIKELLVEGRHGLKRTGAADLSEQEIADLVEFVLSL